MAEDDSRGLRDRDNYEDVPAGHAQDGRQGARRDTWLHESVPDHDVETPGHNDLDDTNIHEPEHNRHHKPDDMINE
ncbi:MAG TPA: hypothetical protein VLA21_12170 [Candidatus Limnocylindria bacterium]|nr:hypothetical protein [Candidatus Limnocylindria bacterium]